MSPFEWGDFLSLAHRLTSRPSGQATEADLRSAIGRAYYAAYHAASDYVRVRSLVPATERLTHNAVWGTLARDNARERSEAGQRGDALRRIRIVADYRNPFPDTDIAARTTAAIIEAESLIEVITRLR